MLGHVFGKAGRNVVTLRDDERAAGYIEMERARVRWFLSVDFADVPEAVREKQSTFRSITVDGREVEFSGGFTDLHTESYRAILAGGGFGVEDVRPSIELVSAIRTMDLAPSEGDIHPAAEKYLRS